MATNIQELQSDEAEKGAWVHGYFKGNKALDFGAGSRGACLRVLDANASIHLSGVFEDNISNERGAVFAANWINNVCNFSRFRLPPRCSFNFWGFS